MRSLIRTGTPSIFRALISCVSALTLFVAAASSSAAATAASKPLRFGIVTDLHFADAKSKDVRHYRDSLVKVREAIERFESERVDFVAVLGDIKDMSPKEPEAATLGHLRRVEAEIRRFSGPTYHVLGNHDMDNLSKAQTLAELTNTGIPGHPSYYAFVRGGYRFIVLDGNFDSAGKDYDHGRFSWKDSNIPEAELRWLEQELKASAEPVIVFVHQRLDGKDAATIKNADAVRRVLEASGKVAAVLQGHEHAGGYTEIAGIHYYTLKGLIEGRASERNAYAIVTLSPEGYIDIKGFGAAVSMRIGARRLAGRTGPD